jgi:hypothetical protein
MEHNYDLIREITEGFVFKTYDNEIPDGYCFSLCYPLSVLFSLMGIEHEITFGKSQKNNIEVSHFWITLDTNGIILDPTIKQFNQNESSVYIGDIQKNETTKKFIKIENIGVEEFHQTYESWAELLLQLNHRRPLPIQLENKLIALNVAASQVLFFYINKYCLEHKLFNSKYGLSYFKPISFVLQHNYLEEQVLICLNNKSLKYKQDIIELSKIELNE